MDVSVSICMNLYIYAYMYIHICLYIECPNVYRCNVCMCSLILCNRHYVLIISAVATCKGLEGCWEDNSVVAEGVVLDSSCCSIQDWEEEGISCPADLILIQRHSSSFP